VHLFCFRFFSTFFLSHLNWVFSWGEKLYILTYNMRNIRLRSRLHITTYNNNNITYDDDDDNNNSNNNNNMYETYTYGYIYTTQRRGSPRYMLLYHIILLLLLFSVTGGNRSNDTHIIIMIIIKEYNIKIMQYTLDRRTSFIFQSKRIFIRHSVSWYLQVACL